ncbi:tetratricopeptide repeat (TPR)-like superfamily protein [Artemisia annua]|uniref:Tetratricopeptide repeat (TPR)-like superfamily protein n=1 Tax=Artemisia annua TaxID=35608 RepID=A0A2U1NDV9_ARTAN|nr:tetratricopeptide repeat (TPR)-like superfamily protein [Artemisia annua]
MDLHTHSQTLSSPSLPTKCLTKCLNQHKNPKYVLITAAKKKGDAPSSQGIQKSSEKHLSHILRAEAAIEAIERKANFATVKSTRFSPKLLLEALDNAVRYKRWESALKIFDLLRNQHWYEPRCQTYTKLLVMLGKCRQPMKASLLFELMLQDGLKPTIDVYTALVSAYGYSGLLDKALEIIDGMKLIPDCKPDVYTYSILINCCTKLRRFDMIKHILADMSYSGIECSIVTYNTIIDGYGKAGLFELMESVLTDMLEQGTCLPDVFTFNSVIGAYGNLKMIIEMEKWFEEFLLMGIQPNVMTFNILIKSYGNAGLYDKMESVMEYMNKRFIPPTVVTFNIIIETFKRAGNIKRMEEFFLDMKHRGMKPNAVTFCSLVSGYGKAGHMQKIDSIMRQIDNSDVTLDTTFFNSVISAYGQAGDMKRMGEMLSAMRDRNCEPDGITFATMIHAYKAMGMVEAAQSLENEISMTDHNPGTRLLEG